MPLYSGDVMEGVKTLEEALELRDYFHMCGAMADGFRYKDWFDFEATIANGMLGTPTAANGVGNGTPLYYMWKTYAPVGGVPRGRRVRKPISGLCSFYRAAVLLVAGAGAGQMAVDYTTGLLTMVADGTSNASSITPGATTQVVLPANLNLIAGELLYLTGFTGADAGLVNNLAHTINSRTGAGPYTFTLATNTAGKTITLGSGQGRKYPQVAETMTWSGQFDTPVRFDIAKFPLVATSYNEWDAGPLPIIELRNP
jgi:hypothetical protein